MLFFTALSPVLCIQPWHPAPPGSERAPCPGLNTLANHGYINRNGKNITQAQISAAFKQVYGIKDDAVNFLLGLLAPGTPGQNQWGNVDLASLAAHNFIEHDASYTHDDYYFHHDALSINYTKVVDLMNHSSDGITVSLDDLVQFKVELLEYSQRNNPEFSLPETPIPLKSLAQYFEMAAPFTVFTGNVSNPLSKQQIASFFGLNRLPSDYKLPSEPVSSLEYLLAQTAIAREKTEALFKY
ncbi:Chloroperoxidase [Gorgonomyces haynaldii]|nr:Chloroperoxidase [Gorgonomyces haynaldii]